MAKLASLLPLIAQGTKARLRGVECSTLSGVPFTCDLRLLNATEEQRIVAAACEASRAAGGTAKDDDLVYQYAFAIEVLAASAVDPESPDDAPQPFFASTSEVREHLDRERILLLSEQQRRFQESASPRRYAEQTEEDFVACVAATAAAQEGEELPFETSPLHMRRRFQRRMALLLSISPKNKSPTGSGDGAAATN